VEGVDERRGRGRIGDAANGVDRLVDDPDVAGARLQVGEARHGVVVDGRGVAVVAPGESGRLVGQVLPDELVLLGVVVVVGNDGFDEPVVDRFEPVRGGREVEGHDLGAAARHSALAVGRWSLVVATARHQDRGRGGDQDPPPGSAFSPHAPPPRVH
jgi:hypothetical protein